MFTWVTLCLFLGLAPLPALQNAVGCDLGQRCAHLVGQSVNTQAAYHLMHAIIMVVIVSIVTARCHCCHGGRRPQRWRCWAEGACATKQTPSNNTNNSTHRMRLTPVVCIWSHMRSTHIGACSCVTGWSCRELQSTCVRIKASSEARIRNLVIVCPQHADAFSLHPQSTYNDNAHATAAAAPACSSSRDSSSSQRLIQRRGILKRKGAGAGRQTYAREVRRS